MSTRTRTAAWAQLLAGGALIAGTLAGAPLLRRRYNRWGATDAELARSMPGDELVLRPKLTYTRAITVDAPRGDVWPWLVQYGQGRGGFYSYDAVENLLGLGIHSAEEVLPEHQHLAVGDLIRSGGRDTYPCWMVMQVEPSSTLVLQGAGTPAKVDVPEIVDEVPERGYVASTWQWLLEPADGGRRTRLIVRGRNTYSPRQGVLWHVIEPLNFVMERKMLLGIKARAEAVAGREAAG
jgi:hypothetical protein